MEPPEKEPKEPAPSGPKPIEIEIPEPEGPPALPGEPFDSGELDPDEL